MREVLESLSGCVETDAGFRVETHCVYPSFSQVTVFIVKIGEGFLVHDGGEAIRESWLHGREDSIAASCLKREALRFNLQVNEDSLVGSVEWIDRLPPLILAVANASASAAIAAVARTIAATEESLVERIGDALSLSFPKDYVYKEYIAVGKSGKEHSFDYGLFDGRDRLVLMSAVAPHHSSISSKYVAFSDTEAVAHKFAVIDRRLPQDDVSLMQQVAEIVPLRALVEGSRRALVRH
jgi:hypothetical protein